MKTVASPFLSKGFVGADERGALAASASSILMRLVGTPCSPRPAESCHLVGDHGTVLDASL